MPELGNENILSDLAFLVDLGSYLNELNKPLQPENQLFNTMFQTINAFEMKLKISQIIANNFLYLSFKQGKIFNFAFLINTGI